jgi:hypothetical protein
MQWEGFTCGSCGSYQEEDTRDSAYWDAQAIRCGRLLKAIFVDRPKKRPEDYKPRLPEPIPPELLHQCENIDPLRLQVFFTGAASCLIYVDTDGVAANLSPKSYPIQVVHDGAIEYSRASLI